MAKWIITLLVTLMALPVLAQEDDEPGEPDGAYTEPEEWQKFERTGETKSCISLHRIYQTDVWDDRTVFFEMRGKTHFVNVLPNQCYGLKFEESFAYSTALTQLCRQDLITVIREHELRRRLDQLGGRLVGGSAISLGYPTCGLGEFIAVTEKPEADAESDGDAGAAGAND